MVGPFKADYLARPSSLFRIFPVKLDSHYTIHILFVKLKIKVVTAVGMKLKCKYLSYFSELYKALYGHIFVIFSNCLYLWMNNVQLTLDVCGFVGMEIPFRFWCWVLQIPINMRQREREGRTGLSIAHCLTHSHTPQTQYFDHALLSLSLPPNEHQHTP